MNHTCFNCGKPLTPVQAFTFDEENPIIYAHRCDTCNQTIYSEELAKKLRDKYSRKEK